jgi:hypothetical protein
MERQAARHKKFPKDIESKASQSALNRAPGVPHDDPFFVTQKGRPRKEHALSNAEQARAYRARQSGRVYTESGQPLI